jgi:putative colanic acid biosynthesis acetyltransferase WcaF
MGAGRANPLRSSGVQGDRIMFSQSPIDLSRYEHTYHPGRPAIVCALWFFIGLPLLRCFLLPSSGFRRWLLRLFGARIGSGVVIKPGVRVKYPWLLEAGDHCWIGEDCWIDNLSLVRLGSHVCVSQGVYFCTGNHDWSDPGFRLRAQPIRVDDGAWICARAFVGPGTEIGEGAVVAAGAVATKSVPPYAIHAGNPAELVGLRKLARRLETPAESAARC